MNAMDHLILGSSNQMGGNESQRKSSLRENESRGTTIKRILKRGEIGVAAAKEGRKEQVQSQKATHWEGASAIPSASSSGKDREEFTSLGRQSMKYRLPV